MDDKTWARIAIQLGIINPGLVEEFERTKQNLRIRKSLPDVLKENGLVNDDDIRTVEALEPVRLHGTPRNEFQREAMRYAGRCVQAGILDEEKATESIRDLVIEGERRPMRELLIERHYATAERLDALDRTAGPAAAPPTTQKRRMRCPRCKLAFEVISRSGRRPDCPRCKTPLENVTATSTVRPTASFDTARVQKPAPPKPGAASTKPRFTCVICDHLFDAALDAGGRVQCPSCGASFDAK